MKESEAPALFHEFQFRLRTPCDSPARRFERGYPQTEVANASFEFQQAVETKDAIIVGVNKFVEEKSEPISLLQIDDTAEKAQRAKLEALRKRRENAAVARSLDRLREGARGTENTMPLILDCVRSYATLGEICDAFREVFGTYTETSIL